MSGWHSVRIGELVDTISNWNPARSRAGAEFDYIDLSAVDQQSKKITSVRKTLCAEAPSRARQLTKAGDVLVSTVRPNLNAVALVPANLDGATASTGFCVLRARPKVVEGNFLFHWVTSPTFVAEMVRKATGASYPAVSDRIVLDSMLPLPPLVEQRRIAAILDQAEELRAKRRQTLTRLATVTKSIFIDMFGDPVANPRGWATASLTDCCDEINDCPHSTPVWTEAGVICLRTSNLIEGGWNWENIRFVSEETYRGRSARGQIRTEDIILSREGTVGVAAIVGDTRVCMGQRLVQVRPSSTSVTSEFMLHHLLYVLAPARVAKLLLGSTAQHVNVKDLKAVRIPLPPLSLQFEFADQFKTVERGEAAQRASLAKLDALFASLQHRAFRGEL